MKKSFISSIPIMTSEEKTAKVKVGDCLTYQTLNRTKKNIPILFTIIGLITVLSFIFAKFYISYYIAPGSYSQMLFKAIGEINEKIDKIYSLKNTHDQHKKFKELEFISPIFPVRLTSTTAVFKMEIEDGEFVILKRVIWNKNNGLNEDKTAAYLKNKHPGFVKLLYSKRTSRYSKVKSEDGEMVEEILLWMFFEFLDIKVSERTFSDDEDKIRKMLKGALEGIKYLHDLGYAHCDIKIPNIMGKQLSNGNELYKLIDFGYTQQFPNSGIRVIPKKNYGTFPYKAPEVILENIHGFPSDIWSIGAVAYYLSLGKIPFYTRKGQKMVDEYRKLAGISKSSYIYPVRKDNLRFAFTKNTSLELRNFVKRCMKVDYKERPSVDELLNDPFIVSKVLTYNSLSSKINSFVSDETSS